MDMNTIQNDLNTILDDLKPVAAPVAPEKTEETISTAEIIAKVQQLKQMSEELLTLLQKAPAALPLMTVQVRTITTPPPSFNAEMAGSVLEGHFNGEKMIGDDGKEYNVPPNYASKSKLVTGDRMKLTITPQGAFIYKQIGPINRKRVIGALEFEAEHNR